VEIVLLNLEGNEVYHAKNRKEIRSLCPELYRFNIMNFKVNTLYNTKNVCVSVCLTALFLSPPT
jgi:hypothetical protein